MKSRWISRADSMTPQELMQGHVLDRIVATTPEPFWRGYQDRTRALYLDAFNAVKADPRLNQSQRLQALAGTPLRNGMVADR
jgi:hypothetical protein